MLLAQTQTLRLRLLAEIAQGLLAEEIRAKFEKRFTEGGSADLAGLESDDRVGVRARASHRGCGTTAIDKGRGIESCAIVSLTLLPLSPLMLLLLCITVNAPENR